MDHTEQSTSVRKQGKRSCARWVLIGFIAIAGYLLFMEHRGHLSGLTYYLPFLLLLACPLLHVFMHGGHGGHGGQRRGRHQSSAPAALRPGRTAASICFSG